ncbi:MAG: NAD+ synthase [Candidatus Omnitrophica bacterium]|nr:NAD+ synthase [Candidatus Omnitrophota bacterium]
MSLRVALAQINTTVGDLEGNARKVVEQCVAARERGADLVVFPELATTGYPPEDLLFKDHFIGGNLKSLLTVARQVSGITAVVGFVDRGPGGELYNAAAVIADGGVKYIYHKQALPNYSVFDEKRYFTPGRGFKLFSLKGEKIAVNVCEDIWVDGGVFQAQAAAGARIIVNISSSPYEFGKREERVKLIARRARETGAFIVYVNLVGGQDELVFDGSSLVVDPQGRCLASGAQFREDLVLVDLPVNLPGKKRAAVPAPLPRIEEMYEAVLLGTRDYIRKNGFQKVLIGLSGGIDSALVAAIAADAVGPRNVVCISMPTRFNVAATRNDARRVARNLGVAFHEIPIEAVVTAFLQTLKPYFKGTPSGLAEENLQSRIRGNLLMSFSNKFGWLVLTTGNKSEMATGYCTLYGDMSGGYAVIKDIYKTKVYELARQVNARAGKAVIPLSVIARAPSAELKAGQKDQDSLPPYPVLDDLLNLYVEGHRSLGAMGRSCGDIKMARKVVELVDKSEYKRRQAPPGVKISKRAFGKDWRLPLTNRYKAVL